MFQMVVEAMRMGAIDYVVKGRDGLFPIVAQRDRAGTGTPCQRRAFPRSALQEHNRNLNLLADVAQTLTSSYDIGEITAQLVRTISQMVGVKGSRFGFGRTSRVVVWFVLVSIPKVFTSDPKIYDFRLAKVLQVSLPALVKQSTLRKHATTRFRPFCRPLLTYQTTNHVCRALAHTQRYYPGRFRVGQQTRWRL